MYVRTIKNTYIELEIMDKIGRLNKTCATRIRKNTGCEDIEIRIATKKWQSAEHVVKLTE